MTPGFGDENADADAQSSSDTTKENFAKIKKIKELCSMGQIFQELLNGIITLLQNLDQY